MIIGSYASRLPHLAISFQQPAGAISGNIS